MLIIVYFFIAVGISFLCSILEAVLLSITPSHIKVVSRKNAKLGMLMQKQKENINISIGAILTLNTFAHTLGAAGVGTEAVKMFGDEYMFYVSAILTLLILIFSEIIPKTLGAYYWKNLSAVCTRLIRLLVFLTYPLVIVMNQITRFLGEKKEKITKEEIAAVANIAGESGVLREKDTDVIENLLSLSELKVKDIHTPRSVMFALEKEVLLKSLKKEEDFDLKKLKEYSRIPVYNGDIDDIEGIFMAKEYFMEYITNELDNKADIIKPVYKVNENIPISKLLDLFLSRNEHMFIVVDNYEQTEGIVTLEDAIETLLGIEIVDESDTTVDKREEAKRKMKALRQQMQLK
jgi:CBS domain containing-hemolysin-like protein